MNDVEPLLLFFFSSSDCQFGVKTYHSLLIGGPIDVIGIDGQSKSFLGPVVFGNEIMVDKTTTCTRIDEGMEVNNLTWETIVEGNGEFHGLCNSIGYKDLSNMER